ELAGRADRPSGDRLGPAGPRPAAGGPRRADLPLVGLSAPGRLPLLPATDPRPRAPDPAAAARRPRSGARAALEPVLGRDPAARAPPGLTSAFAGPVLLDQAVIADQKDEHHRHLPERVPQHIGIGREIAPDHLVHRREGEEEPGHAAGE